MLKIGSMGDKRRQTVQTPGVQNERKLAEGGLRGALSPPGALDTL